MNWLLVVFKPLGFTSRDVVNIVGKKLNTKKVGHTGTLDPLATGILVLCIGSSLKLVELLTNHDKEYIAKIKLGVEKDTLDITWNIIKRPKVYKKWFLLKQMYHFGLNISLSTLIQRISLNNMFL